MNNKIGLVVKGLNRIKYYNILNNMLYVYIKKLYI